MRRASRAIQAWLERLLPGERYPDPDALRRARLTVLLSTVLIVAAAGYTLFYALLVHYAAGAWIIGTGGVVAAIALAALRGHATIRLLGHVLIGVLYSALVGIVGTSGGLPSPAAPWLVMPPMFAALLLGRRSAAAWTTLCVITTVAVFAAARFGVHFPVGYGADWALAVLCASYAGLVGCSAVLIFVFEAIREQAHARAESARAALARLAYHDVLTGLTNRARFVERVAAALTRAAEAREPGRVAVLLLDLDGFKLVNDSHGHATGDALLVEVAGRLLNATRGSDTVARLGGDEFAVLMDNVRHDADTAIVADRIVEALAAPFVVDGHEVRVGSSVGVARAMGALVSVPAESPERPDAVARLLHDADVAMYRAKARGKGQWVRYEPGMLPGPKRLPAPAVPPDRRRGDGRAHLGRV